jgi:N-acetylneuraminic acid mutarotase
MLPFIATVLLAWTAPASSAATRTLTFEERVAAEAAIERVRYAHQRDASRSFADAIPDRLARENVLRFLEQTRVLHEVFGTTATAAMLERETVRIAANTHLPGRLAEVNDALGNDPFLVKECFVRPRLIETLLVERFRSDARLHAAARALAERARAAIERGDAPPLGLQAWATALRLQDAGEPARPERVASPGERVVSREEYAATRSRFPDRRSRPSATEETPSGYQFYVVEQESETAFRGVTYVAPKVSFTDWWLSVRRQPRSLREPAIAKETPLPVPRPSAIEASETYCSADDTWEPSIAVPAPRRGAAAIWIGDSMLVWGGGGAAGRGDRYFPDTGEWTTFSTVGLPGGTPIWTGTQLIVFAGALSATYDPAADSWHPLSTVGAPTGGTPVWTGTHLVVVAGAASASYDPATNTWQPISSIGAPAGGHAVWTGQHVLVSTGAKYDPATDLWSPISTDGACTGTHAFWTGDLFLVFRGNLSSSATDSGCRYDPAADEWAPIPPQMVFADSVLWTGTKILTLSGRQNDQIAPVATYDPATDAWTRGGVVVTERYDTAAVWTGTEALLWGGQLEGTFGTAVYVNTGVRLDGDGHLLGPTSLGRIPVGSVNHTSTWTGDEAIIWGGWSRERGPYTTVSECRQEGGAFDPVLSQWRPVSSTAAPEARGRHSSIWTGNELLVWGGLGSCNPYQGGTPLASGSRYDPLTDSWSPMSTTGAPGPRFDHTAVWTGDRMVIWGGAGGMTTLGDGAAYDPSADSWSAVGGVNAPLARRNHTAVWTGTEMIVWGGTGPAGVALGDGARLDPSTGQWLPLSSLQAPDSRAAHVAVWTGSEMLIWGGGPQAGCYGSNGPAGGRYSPALDAWSPISEADAPVPDCGKTAVWTGSEMIVSGGGYGRYSPDTDSWVSSVPPSPWFSLVSSASVWTGAQMLLWGGYGTVSPPDTIRDGALINLGQLADADGDGVSICDGDCDDHDPLRSPGTLEVCDGIDNDCDGVVDDGFDVDLDGVVDCLDNCAVIYNPGQADGDADGLGDDCDTCPQDALNDADADGYCANVDNCAFEPNPDQTDADSDFEGDVCDLDDGLLLFGGVGPDSQIWQPEVVYGSFNLYRGDLAVLRSTGEYTQDLTNLNADRFCGLADHVYGDAFEPPTRQVVFYLVTGVAGGVESSLGTSSAGTERPNDWPCP